MMNNELAPIQISIKDKKKTFVGIIVRAALNGPCKVVQVRTADEEDYYLIYFKKSFIFGDKLESIPAGSFIDQAYREGIVIESAHPMLAALTPKQMVVIPTRNKLFPQLQARYSLQEIAYIATTIDAFYARTFLEKFIEQIYFNHKRNGQYMKAYQILQILTSFSPELKSAKEWISSRDFNSAHDFYYSSSLSAILKKDPLHAEICCFKNRSNPNMYFLIEVILTARESFPELILVWLEKTRKMKEPEEISKYTKIALKIFTMEQWIFTLTEEKINPFHVLPEAKTMIEKLMEKGDYEVAAFALLHFMDDLPAAYDSILRRLWESVDAAFVETHLNSFIRILEKQRDEDNDKQLEAQVYQLIVTMLKEYDLKAVYSKLLPLMKVIPHSVVFRKLSNMVMLLEDPDRMMELGDFYAEFEQYDPAIDCYSWEMELKPQDPDPVWKICKMYQQKGMAAEAAAYQKVFVQLKDIQESI